MAKVTKIKQYKTDHPEKFTTANPVGVKVNTEYVGRKKWTTDDPLSHVAKGDLPKGHGNPTKPGVDWSKIESEYRAGIISLREIGARHGISHITIGKKAKRLGWTRNLTAAVQQAVQTKRALEMVGHATGSNMNEEELVEHAAKVAIEVENKHREDIKVIRERTMSLGRMIDEVLATAKTPDATISKAHLLALGRDGLIGANESVVRSYDRVVKVERHAYGLDARQGQDDPDKAGSALERLLDKLDPQEGSSPSDGNEPSGPE